MSDAPPSSAPQPSAFIEWLLIPAGLLVILFALPHSIVGDDNARFRMLSSLLEGHPAGGRYSWAGPIFAAPLWLVGRAFGNPGAGVLYYDVALFAGALVAFYFLLRNRWETETLRHFLVLLVAGSMFARHLLHFGAEAFTALTAGVGLMAVAVGAVRAGFAVAALAAVNTPAALPGFGLAALRRAWTSRRLRYLLVPLAALALILLDTWVRTGSPFQTGYEGDHGMRTFMPYSGKPGMSFPLFFGLLSITASFGKGILFFAPGLWLLPAVRKLALPEPLREALWLWLAFLLGLILFYAKWWSWYGGFGAGPRFFAFASLPASLLLAQALSRRTSHWAATLGLLVALALSCWVAVATTVFENGGSDICTANGYVLEHLCWYTPEFSVLWNPFVGALPALATGQWVVIAYEGLVFALLAVPLLQALGPQLAATWENAKPTQGWKP